jgi:hypothetical protein
MTKADSHSAFFRCKNKIYIHNNPVSGKWMRQNTLSEYEHKHEHLSMKYNGKTTSAVAITIDFITFVEYC